MNNYRALPSADGLKAVQRRILLSLNEVGTSWIKSAAVVGTCLAKFHPHGESGVYDTLVLMVRRRLVEGHGNFGCKLLESLPPAAMRYTKVKVNSNLMGGIFPLISYVKHEENDLGVLEPLILPTPIPFALCTGTVGVGVGVATRIPAFSPESLLVAYKSDDPTKLRSYYNLDIIDADYKTLWENGYGKIRYRFKTNKQFSDFDGKDVSIIEGSGELFSPRLDIMFKEFVNNDLAYIRDESSEQLRIIVSRIKHIRSIDDQEVHRRVLLAAERGFSYSIYLNMFGVAKQIGIREWLDICYKNYTAVFNLKQQDVINTLEKSIEEFKVLPTVTQLLSQNIPAKEISSNLNISVNTISSIEERPIKLLRKSNYDSEVKLLQNKLDKVKKWKVETEINKIVNSIKS